MHLQHQLKKAKAHYQALQEYYDYIKNNAFDFSVVAYKQLDIQDRAVLEAYLKRFASLQDYLGAKVFSSLLDSAGISYTKMSEVLVLIEKEGIMELGRWIEFRNVRNDLEHDYPEELEDALNDLRYCVEAFEEMEQIVQKVFAFARSRDESIELH